MHSYRMILRSLLVIVCMLLFVTLWLSHPVRGFSDIHSSPQAESILSWKYEGLTNGFGDGTFRPESQITRAETVALINRAFLLEEQGAIGFSDVFPRDWFYQDVMIAKEMGYIEGFADNTFRPHDAVTRQQLAVIIQRILQLPDSDAYTELNDAKLTAEWSRGAIGSLVSNGIFSASSDLFRPADFATRAEVVTMLDQARDLLSEGYTVRYDKPGTYGPPNVVHAIDGDVRIESGEITLMNIEIRGDLILSSAVKEDSVMLFQVVVHGKVTVEFPGTLSLFDTTVNELVVNVPGPVSGTTHSPNVYAHVNRFGKEADPAGYFEYD